MIKEIERYAKENGVPIMLSDGIEYLCNFILEHNVKSVLDGKTTSMAGPSVLANLQ